MNALSVRMLIYIFSLVLGSVPAVALGWFSYQFVDGMIHISISVEGAAATIAAAVGGSWGVLHKWGIK